MGAILFLSKVLVIKSIPKAEEKTKKFAFPSIASIRPIKKAKGLLEKIFS